MSKKKCDYPDYVYDIADSARKCYESYLDSQQFIIHEGVPVEVIEDAVKKVKKLIKCLKKGDLEEVCDPDALEELIENAGEVPW